MYLQVQNMERNIFQENLYGGNKIIIDIIKIIPIKFMTKVLHGGE